MSHDNNINTDDCWLWAMGVTQDDYGTIKGQYAHRMVYENMVGAIPHKYQIDHLCFTPRCINPLHLEAVPEIENIRRSWRKRMETRNNKCLRGHKYEGANLYIENGKRRCRACKSINNHNYHAKRKLKRDLGKS